MATHKRAWPALLSLLGHCRSSGLLRHRQRRLLARDLGHICLELPRDFVRASLDAHTERARAKQPASLLAYPLWLYTPPESEVDEGAIDAPAAARLFTPPLRSSLGSRGWRLTQRLEPAAAAPLAGERPVLAAGGWPTGPGVLATAVVARMHCPMARQRASWPASRTSQRCRASPAVCQPARRPAGQKSTFLTLSQR